ncbi:hypothetical protein VIGAN_11067800, partial [Vigna angularis var. angularis]
LQHREFSCEREEKKAISMVLRRGLQRRCSNGKRKAQIKDEGACNIGKKESEYYILLNEKMMIILCFFSV